MATKFTSSLRLPERVAVKLRELSKRDSRPQWLLLTESLVCYKDKYPEAREPNPGMKKGRPKKEATPEQSILYI